MVGRVTRRAVIAAFLVAGLASASLAADYADGNYALTPYQPGSRGEGVAPGGVAERRFPGAGPLGDVYSNPSDGRYYDPVEAYVWYYLAGRNRMGHGRMWDDEAADVIRIRRGHAIDKQQELLLELSTDQRTEARERITYILSCHGADGFLMLGRISETQRATYDDDDDGQGRPRRRPSWRRPARRRPAGRRLSRRLRSAAIGHGAQRFRRAGLFPHRRRDGQSARPRLSQHDRELHARQLFRRAHRGEAGQEFPLLVPAPSNSIRPESPPAACP